MESLYLKSFLVFVWLFGGILAIIWLTIEKPAPPAAVLDRKDIPAVQGKLMPLRVQDDKFILEEEADDRAMSGLHSSLGRLRERALEEEKPK